MKIALIADIQGNALALETVLEQLQVQQPDVIVSLGDVACGPEPAQVLSLLRTWECLTVRGNMEDVILQPEPCTGDDDTLRRYADMDVWCSHQLSPADRAMLDSFQSTISLDLGYGKTLLGCHGSPRSYDDVIDSTTSEEDLARLLDGHQASIVAVGHMHHPMLRQFQNTLLLNPGSVGFPGGGHQPMQTVAQYAVIRSDSSQLSISFHSVEYDARQFRQRVLAAGMPHAEWYLSKWQT